MKKIMTQEQLLSMFNKLLNLFVKPKFPEIEKIIVSEGKDIFEGWFEITVILDGTEESQELIIDNEIENILKYTGIPVRYNLNFEVQ